MEAIRRKWQEHLLQFMRVQDSIVEYDLFIQEALVPIIEDAYDRFETEIRNCRLKYGVRNITVRRDTLSHVVDVENRNDTCCCHVYADVFMRITNVSTQEEVYFNEKKHVHLFSIPVVLGSAVSPLFVPEVQKGLYSVRGNSRVLVPVHRKFQNRIILEHRKDAFVLEFRAEDPMYRHKSTQNLKFQMRKHASLRNWPRKLAIEVNISWMRRYMPLHILLRAMDIDSTQVMSVVEMLCPAAVNKYAPNWTYLQTKMAAWEKDDALYMYAKRYLRDTSNVSREKAIHVAQLHIDHNICVHVVAERRTPWHRLTNLMYLCLRLLAFRMGEVSEMDKDSLATIEVDGTFLIWSNFLRQQLGKHLKTKIRVIRAHVNKHRTLLHHELLIPQVFRDNLTQRLIKFVNTGRFSEKKAGLTQLVASTNHISVLAHKRKTMSALKGKDGSHFMARMLHDSSYQRVCVAETPDSKDVGLTNHRALFTRATLFVSSEHFEFMVLYLLREQNWFVPLSDTSDASTLLIGTDGEVLGKVKSPAQALAYLRKCKREGYLYQYAAIWWDRVTNELYTSCRAGRHITPFIHISSLSLEWLDAVEVDYQAHRTIATQPHDLQYYPQAEYMTVSDVAHLGITSALIVFGNRDTGVRETYACQMMKQTISIPPAIPAINHYTLTFPERPLICTRVCRQLGLEHKLPMNHILLCIYSHPDAIEDGVVISESCFQRMNMHKSSVRKHQMEKQGINKQKKMQFLKPEPAETLAMNNTNVSHLHDMTGMAKVGSVVTRGDIVIGCVTTNENKSVSKSKNRHLLHDDTQIAHGDHVLLRNHSRLMSDEVGEVIDSSIHANVRKVYTRTESTVRLGDKFGDRHAQKGVVAAVVPEYNMFYSKETLVPMDACFCVEGFPTRMTMGKLVEMLLGKAAAISGETFDDEQIYDTNDLVNERAMAVLREAGFDPLGTETLVDPLTGEDIPVPVMVGVVSYECLTHLVHKKIHARSTGKTDAFTRQPVSGRRNGGGQIEDYMKLYAAGEHGAAAYIRERTMEQSDPDYQFGFCQKCGQHAIINQAIEYNWCRKCDTDEHIVQQMAPYSLSLLEHHLAATGIKMTYERQTHA